MEQWNDGIMGYQRTENNILLSTQHSSIPTFQYSGTCLMLRPAPHIRYHIAAILASHWIQFMLQYKRWIRPVVFENVHKVLACRTPVLGCHIYQCKNCGHVELIPHSCKSRYSIIPSFLIDFAIQPLNSYTFNELQNFRDVKLVIREQKGMYVDQGSFPGPRLYCR